MDTGTTATAAPRPRQPTRARLLVLGGCFSGLLIVSSLLTVALTRDGIEADLGGRAARAVENLEQPGNGTWTISFRGRDGELRGEVFDETLAAKLVDRIAGLHGVRTLDAGGLRFREMADPWLSLAIDADSRSLTADGLLPSAGGSRTRLIKALRGLGPDVPAADAPRAADANLDAWRVIDRIKEDADVFAPTWVDGIGAIVAVLVENPRARHLEVRDGRAVLEGEVFSGETFAALSIAADAAFSKGLAIDNQFRVVDPPAPPSLFLVWETEGIAALAGTVADAEAKRRMEALIAGALPPETKLAGELVAGENTGVAPWEEAVGLLVPGLVSETRTGSLSIEDRQVRITGELGSEEMRESLRQMARECFPGEGGYQFDIGFTVHVPPRSPIMSVIHLGEAGVKLKGVVGSESTRDAFVALARARLPATVPVDAALVEIERHTTEPAWTAAFADILPGFVGNTSRGGLTVYENSLVIEAEVPTEAKWDALWQLAENHFPDPDFTRDVQLRVVDPLLPPDEDLGPEDPDAVELP